jgi:hypothetical protein
MRPLSAAQLLALWEQGQGQPAWQRALALLAAALPEVPPEALARLTPGQRDACLLALREGLFGARLASLVTCPACGERLELNFALEDIRAGGLPEWGEGGAPAQAEVLSLALGAYQVRFRLPNSLDLAALEGLSSPQQARQCLLARCLLSALENGEARAADELPEALVAAMTAQMAEADPQADVQIELTCPACAQRWQAAFDPLAFLWAEIQAWAQRSLREVHLLASAYGWREADILALSPRRREAYLQLVMGSP